MSRLRLRHVRCGLLAASLAIGPLAVGHRGTAAETSGPVTTTATEPGLSTIASVRATDVNEPHRRVVVRGRVTWVTKGGVVHDYAAIQDDTAGIWLDVKLARETGIWRADDVWHLIQPGMLVEVAGARDDGAFAPQIVPESLRILSPPGDLAFPKRCVTTPERLSNGIDDSQWVTVEGIVQGFVDDGEHWLLTLAAGGRRFRATVPSTRFAPDPAAVIDAVVSATGVATTRYTTRGQLVTANVVVARDSDLQVVAEPPAAPFETPLISPERLARFALELDPDHRIRTRGSVSYAAGGRLFFLQSGAIGVRVETLLPESLEPGDVVEVAGFLDRGRVLAGIAQAAGVVDAVVRVVGKATRPTATVIQPDRILDINRQALRLGRIASPGDYDGSLIECHARLSELRPGDRGATLLLVAGDTPLTATVSREVLAGLPRLEPGCELSLRGIVQFDIRATTANAPWNLPDIERISLLVPSAADVTVIRPVSWWTVRRLSVALAVVAAVLAGALGWAAVLRWQVARQSLRLAAEITARQRAHIEFEAALQERTRLAANLHDTVLQTVTGIGYQLKACRRMSPSPSADVQSQPEGMAVVERMVEQAVDQLRGTVWAMRTVPPGGQSFTASLQSLAARAQEGQSTRIVVHVAGVDRDVPESIAGELVLVAQEAMVNALRHSGATTIDIMAVFEEDAVGVVIEDDGRGFETAARAGTAERHFGIDGMGDRMRRLGGSLRVEPRAAGGITVTAIVPRDTHGDLSNRPVVKAPGPTYP